MTYQNLEIMIFKRGVKKSAIAKALGISQKALYNKMKGRAPFTWQEVCLIQNQFFPDISKESLFSVDKSA